MHLLYSTFIIILLLPSIVNHKQINELISLISLRVFGLHLISCIHLYKYKGQNHPSYFLGKGQLIFGFYSSTLGTSLLMLRQVYRHPSWYVLICRIIECICNFCWNCMRIQLCLQLHVHVMFSWWVSSNLSGHQESCCRRWEPKNESGPPCFEGDDAKDFSSVFWRKSFVFTKVICSLSISGKK